MIKAEAVVGRGKKIDDVAIVLEAATMMIEKSGIEEFSTRRLAAALRISAMTLYNYFADRNAILKDVSIRCMDDFNRSTEREIEDEARADPNGNPIRAFKLIARRLLDLGMAKPRLYLFLFDSSASDLREDPEVSGQYEHFVGWVVGKLGDRSLEKDLHRDVLLFQLLANSLVIACIRWPKRLDQAKCLELVDRAYDRLLSSYERSFPAR